MSDSAEGDVPGPGAKTGTSAPAQAPIEPETAERFASAFVPAWQFEDAPFSAGPSFSAGEIRDLGAVGNANAPQNVPTAATATDPFPAAARDETIRTEPSVVVANDVLRETMALTTRIPAVKATPTAAPTRRLDETQVVVVRPRSKTVLVGIGAAVAVVLSVLGFLLTRAEAPAQPATPSAASSSGHVAENLPAPPSASPSPPSVSPSASPPASPPPPEASATPATVTPPPVAQAPVPLPPREAPSPPPPPRQAAAAPPMRTQEATRPTHNPPKNPPKSAGGGIVRDNPF